MRSSIKFLSFVSLAGLLLGTGACDSRKQYKSSPPPAAVDKNTTSITPSDKLPQLVDGTGNVIDNPTDIATPEQVIALVSEWSRKPIVWNKSVGGVVIGETDLQKWRAEFIRLISIASVNLDFFPDFQSPNLTARNGQIVSDTFAGIRIYDTYQGELPITRPDGSVINIVLQRDSLIDAGIIPAEARGNPESSASKDFFRKFYRKFADDAATADLPKDFDCFEEGYCFVEVEDDSNSRYFLYRYSTPTGNSGIIWISLESYKILQIYFRAPKNPGLDILSQGTTQLDLERGLLRSVVGQQVSDLASLGDTFAVLPDTTFKATLGADGVGGKKSEWLPESGNLIKVYAQGLFWFTSNDILSAEKKPDSNTGKFAQILLNKNFPGKLYLGSRALDDFRLNKSIKGASVSPAEGTDKLFEKGALNPETAKGHREYLLKLRDVIDESPKLEVVSSALYNLESIDPLPAYSANIIYKNVDTKSYYGLTFTTFTSDPSGAQLVLSIFDNTAAALLTSKFEESKTANTDSDVNLRPVFGSIKPGGFVALRDVIDQYSDESGLNRAKLVTAEDLGGKVVDLTKNVILNIPVRTNTVSYDFKRIKAMSVSFDTGDLSLVEEKDKNKCKDLNLTANDRCFMVAAVTVTTGKFNLNNSALGIERLEFAIGEGRKKVLGNFYGDRKALVVSDTADLPSTKSPFINIVDMKSRVGNEESTEVNVDLNLRLTFSPDDKLSAVDFYAPEILN